MLEELLEMFSWQLDAINAPLQTQVVPGWGFGEPQSHPDRDRFEKLWDVVTFYSVFPRQVEWYGGSRLRLEWSNENSRQIFVERSFDPNEFALLSSVIKPGMTFVDVGANIGCYTLFAAKAVGQSGKVFSFEPSSREIAALTRNLALNGLSNVSVFPFAVGETAGVATLELASDRYNGHNTVGKLKLFENLPSLRYSTDGLNYYWTTPGNKAIEIPIGAAQSLELFLYSDRPFEYTLNALTILPEEGVRSAPLVSAAEPAVIPPAQAVKLSKFAISTVGDVVLNDGAGLFMKGAGEGAGVMFKATLDPSYNYTVVLDGFSAASGCVDRLPVQMISLDSFLSGSGAPSIDVIKLDIEGFELAALKGAQNILKRHQPLLLVEVVQDLLEGFGASAAELKAFLNENNYVLFDVREGPPRLVDLEGAHASNVFAVPERFLDQVLALGGLDRTALTAGLRTSETDSAPGEEPVTTDAGESGATEGQDRPESDSMFGEPSPVVPEPRSPARRPDTTAAPAGETTGAAVDSEPTASEVAEPPTEPPADENSSSASRPAPPRTGRSSVGGKSYASGAKAPEAKGAAPTGETTDPTIATESTDSEAVEPPTDPPADESSSSGSRPAATRTGRASGGGKNVASGAKAPQAKGGARRKEDA